MKVEDLIEAGVDGTVTGYMCYIDFVHELGNASDGNRVYPSIKALKREHTCWEECGIVEVEVKIKQVVVEPQH